MRALIIFLLFNVIAPGFRARAQRNIIAALEIKLAKAKDPNERINISNAIAYEMRVFSPDSAMAISRENIEASENAGFTYGLAVSNICFALASSGKANYEIAIEYANRALVIGEQLKNDSVRAAATLAIAGCYYNKSNYDLAIEKALAAVRWYEEIGNNNGVTKGRLLMAQIYQLKNDLPAAEKILRQLAAEKRDDMKVQVNILHTLANVYGMQNKYPQALELDRAALAICESNGLEYLKSQVYDNMANCFMYDGKLQDAELYFYKCIALDSSFGNKKQLADTYLNLGQLSLMKKNAAEAIPRLLHSISLSKESGYRQGTYAAWLLLSKAYDKNNEKDNALLAINKGYELKDSIINERSEDKIAEMETLYQSEKKEQELLRQKNRINKTNIYLIALSIFILLLTASGVLYFRKRALQSQFSLQEEVLRQQDIATKAIIEAEENERKRIAADLHDGVGQLMSAAKMNLSVFEDEISFRDPAQREKFETVISLIDESCKEIRNVSHQMMPNALLKSGLASAVKEFLSKIDNRVIKVALHTEGLRERLPANVETVLYRVIQECVNNVLKHSGANHLDISIFRDTEGIAVTVEDNGRGFDPAAKSHKQGLGLKNMASRVAYLQGSVDFSSAPGKGTLVAIHVPATV